MLVHVALLYVVNNSGVSRNSYGGGGGAKSESLFFFLLLNFSRGPSSENSRENDIFY